MLVDFYELTMSNGYYENGYADSVVYCDMFFRKILMEQVFNYSRLAAVYRVY